MKTHEVVISGMAGTFPECQNTKQLEAAAFSSQSLVTDDDRKWTRDCLWTKINATGKVKDLYKFDNMFFGIHRKLDTVMDVICKHGVEKTYAAICDAGLNPHDLSGEKVAVIFASMTLETEYNIFNEQISNHGMLGQSKTMQANRISYFFNFTGPSLSVDSTWIGPIQALAIGRDLVAKGHVKMAIVGAGSLMVNPNVSYLYDNLGKLNPDGKTKSYSANADGYSRSEGIGVFVLQRASEAFRSYGTVVKAACQTEMNHKAVFSDQIEFNQFLEDFYSDIPSYVKENDIAYIEGDGSASLANDALELNGLADILCPGRKKPLLVGSCKSLLGHAESCAAFISLVNAIIAMKTGYIPPVLHFSGNNPLVPALTDGRIKIVTEKTKLEGDYVGVSAFGLSSAYGHVLLKRNPKSIGVRDNSYFPPDGIPRLFLISGRDENLMRELLKKIEEEPVNEYYYALNHKVLKSSLPQQLYRGVSVVGEERSFSETVVFQSGSTPPIWFVFSGMGSQWTGMGAGIMKVPAIRRSIERSHAVLLSKGLNLIEIVTTEDPQIFDDILHSFVGIAAIQIALVDLLEEIGIHPDGIVGHSVGELGCSYADKCLTAEQVILAAYARGKASNDAALIKGMMAAVGKGYNDIKDELPEGIEVACHNSKDSCTLSGPAELMETYVDELKNKGVFARLVNVANIAYHSKNIAPAAPYLLRYLKEIIPEPKARSNKWISSSVPEDKWGTDSAKYCSAEYHTNNLLSYVLFEEATAHVPNDALCIEIAPHGLLQAITKKSLPSCIHVPLTDRRRKEGCYFLIQALGKLFMSGVDMNLAKLYPPVAFPVPREVDYLEQIVTWYHKEELIPETVVTLTKTDINKMKYALSDKYLSRKKRDERLTSPEDYVIRATSLFPKASVMNDLIRSMMDKVENKSSENGYHFECVHFLEDVTFNEALKSSVQSLHQRGSGKFEMITNTKILMVGILKPLTEPLPPSSLPSDWSLYNGQKTIISEIQIHDYFSANECFFRGPYRNISCITITERGFNGKIKWTGDSELFLDGIFRLCIFYWSIKKDELMDIMLIEQFLFDPSSLPENVSEIDIYYDDRIGQLAGEGVRMSYIKSKPMKDSYSSATVVHHKYFSAYGNIDSDVDMAEMCLQLIRGNNGEGLLDVQLVIDESSSICNRMLDAVLSKPLQDLMINFRIGNAKQVASLIPEAVSAEEINHCYLIISENETTEIVKMLLELDIPLYVLHFGDAPKYVGKLTELYIQRYHDYRVVLYTRKMSSISRHDYVALSDNYLNELMKMDPKSKKVKVYIYKYRSFSEIANFLMSITMDSNNTRFVFIDETAPAFNPSHKFYKDQLKKDLKINIASGDKWGSFTDKLIPATTHAMDVKYSEIPINCIRCAAVDLKAVGLNLMNAASRLTPTKFGLIDYSGKLGNDEVLGLGKLTEDCLFEVDKILRWRKPMLWTYEQAATVPLFYAMAYQLLHVKLREGDRPCGTLLIHCGHTPFSQAVIHVALSMDIEVFTTCYSETQKEFILEKFPQIAKHNILIIIEGGSNYDMISYIMKRTDGDGVKVLIDPIEEFSSRLTTIDCVGIQGQYCYISHNDDVILHHFGMRTLLNEKSIMGLNPELILDMADDNKRFLAEIVQSGIDNHSVKPLENYTIQGFCSRKQATDIIIEHSNCSRPAKVLMKVDKKQSLQSYKTKTKELAGKKNYVIVGSYNSLWFDIMKWLISRGADSIRIVLDQKEMPQNIKIRYNNFIKKQKYVTITLNGTENLNTAQSCDEFIKKLNDRHSIDILFYIKPGFEKRMTNLDLALRTHSKSTYLVSIGVEGCAVTEKWKQDGYKGIAFILMRDDLKNSALISVLDDWLENWDPVHGFVTVDKPKDADDTKDKYSDILPVDASELLDLYYATENEPSLKEVSTRCPPTHSNSESSPVIIFPGLKTYKAEEFAKKLVCPTYEAKYPLMIKSLNELASQFSKLLIESFDLNMFTLVAEGWSGPLVLYIAKLLEDNGKISEIILLDASPSAIEQWPSHLIKCRSIISKYMPSMTEDDKFTVNDLKNIAYHASESMARESPECTQDELLLGLETLINRLEVIHEFSLNDLKIKSVIHIFTPENANHDIKELDQICLTLPCKHHVLKGVNCKSFLQCPKLVEDVCYLALVEYKNCANKQEIAVVATLDLLFDSDCL